VGPRYGTCYITPFWSLDCWKWPPCCCETRFPPAAFVRFDAILFQILTASLNTLVQFQKVCTDIAVKRLCGFRAVERNCYFCMVFTLCNVIALSSQSTRFLGAGLSSLIPRMLQRPPCPINTLWLFPGDICSHKGSGTSSGYINIKGEGCTIPLTRRLVPIISQPFPCNSRGRVNW